MRPAPLVRLWDELLYVLRREGLPISTEQAQVALRALALVGVLDLESVGFALSAVLAGSPTERRLLERVLREHFKPGLRGKTLWERLEAAGFDATERSAVADWLRAHDVEGGADALMAWLEPGAARDDLLARATALQALRDDPDQSRLGFLLHRVLAEAQLSEARAQHGALELYLRDALGAERAAELSAFVRAELEREARQLQRELRDGVRERMAEPPELSRTPLAQLDAEELRLAERAVQRLAQRMVARARARQKRARRGEIDLRATKQRSKATFGVPVELRRKRPRPRPARLIVLCDVSESVRSSARQLLLFLYSAQKCWDSARSFVFVSELAETTELFRREPVERALTMAYGGGLLPTHHNSNYARAFARLEEKTRSGALSLDHDTALVILGDGRSNFLAPGTEILARLAARARSTVWLCPEPEASWGRGDSRMLDYRAVVDAVLPVSTLHELTRALAAF